MGPLASGASPGQIRHAFLMVITDHFLGYGHPMIYCQKAFALLDWIGWSEAAKMAPALLVPAFAWSTRYYWLPYMRRFLVGAGNPTGLTRFLGRGHGTRWSWAAAGAARRDAEGRSWRACWGGPRRRAGAADHRRDRLGGGGAARPLRHRLGTPTTPGRACWLNVTHTLTYKSGPRWAWSVDPGPVVLRGVLHAAWFVQWAAKFDAAQPQAPVAARPGSDPDAVLAADQETLPGPGGGALVKGYYGAAAPLRTALTQAAAEDNSTAAIMVGTR